eukprot:15985938-Heterocapsa_arctica.AAC.1
MVMFVFSPHTADAVSVVHDKCLNHVEPERAAATLAAQDPHLRESRAQARLDQKQNWLLSVPSRH